MISPRHGLSAISGGRTGLALALLALVPACSGSAPASPPPTPATTPRYDEVWQVSTHNSYWVDRGIHGDLYASGTEERLADELLFDHARGVEIDIHPDPATPHAFLVYHTMPGNVLCGTLPQCLSALRVVHHALPQHEAIHVTLELKGITAPTFDADHSIEDLDRILRDELGASLYTPADFLARCSSAAATLAFCGATAGWPAVGELRGRFIVSPLGNWDGLPGSQATKDWALYALHGNIRDRAGFPMASSWQLDRESLSGPIYDLVTQAELDQAFAQSVFMQVEDVSDARIAPFLRRHGIVRIDGSFTADDQRARAAVGMQLLQTDSPWIQNDDRGPTEPYRSLVPGFATIREPGARLHLGPGKPGERLFAHATVSPSGATTWEAAVSSGSDASRVGCLRAAAAVDTTAETSITVCRTKTPAARMTGAGKPGAEQVIVRVETCGQGKCATEEFASKDPMPGGPGDLIRLTVNNQGSGMACARVASASAVDRDLVPTWGDLGAERCFPAPLLFQGIAAAPRDATSPADAHFFGARRDGADVRAESLDGGAALADDSSP